MTSFAIPEQDNQPVDWISIYKNILCWVRDSLNIPVIWENQNIPQPPYPYVSLLRQSEVDEGGVDEKRQINVDQNGNVTTNPEDAFENEEISYQPVSFAVTIQAHVDFQNGSTNPGVNAPKLLGLLKRRLYQTSTLELFDSCGLSIIAPEDIQDLSLVINGEWVSRAAFDIRFRTASVLTERVPFIEQVELRSEQLGVDTIVDAS